MATKQEFAAFMTRLSAAMPKFAPNTSDPNVLRVWFAEIGHLETPALTAVYRAVIAKYDAFPSIRQCLEEAGESPQSDEDKGRDVAERIFTALCRGWASTLTREVMVKRDEFVGEIGCEVVRMQGGWAQVSEMTTDDNAMALKAQWRELAAVIVRKARSGQLTAPPKFDALPEGDLRRQVGLLAEKFNMR